MPYPRPPKGKTRLIVRMTDGRVTVDTLVDNGSVNIVTLPADLGIRLEKVTTEVCE
jgi:hypothetical protein